MMRAGRARRFSARYSSLRVFFSSGAGREIYRVARRRARVFNRLPRGSATARKLTLCVAKYTINHDLRPKSERIRRAGRTAEGMMHWSDKIALDIIRRKPDKAEYVCAAGISPSGSIHIGNFRDIATSYFVVKALRKRGKKAKLLFSWDEFDRLRKIPANVAKVNDGMKKYIGFPYVDAINPFGTEAKSYAEHFEREFEAAIEQFGIDMELRHQAEMYRGGKYRAHILLALKKRFEIFDILDSHRTQDAAEGERDAYYPVSIYCPKCGRDTTAIHSLSDDGIAEYSCKCGFRGAFDFARDANCKLAWKVDWAMRWMHESVDFEPGGKDHASANGSYDSASEISRRVFGYEPPIFQGYEFIGISDKTLRTGKMSGSSGLNLTPGTLLKLYEPEILLWLYAKNEPMRAFNFCLDDGILRQYFEFDKMLTDSRNGVAQEFETEIMSLCEIEGRSVTCVPMNLIAQLGAVVDFNAEMLEVAFDKIGLHYSRDDFKSRLERAKFWLERCAPESVNRLATSRNRAAYEAMSENEKKEIRMLHEYLAGEPRDLDALQARLYAIPMEASGLSKGDKALKSEQSSFFRNVYRLLLNRDSGPRLYLFLRAIEKDRYLRLLDFSAPFDESEPDAPTPAPAEERAAEPRARCAPDPVRPAKPEIGIDEFRAIDLRVCKVAKCQEIRKSDNCYKITAFDGIGERVIVSSLRDDYAPEELVGRKIVIAANLKPIRITGVESEGMLLAATDPSCGCKVIFVDDAVPEGTVVC